MRTIKVSGLGMVEAAPDQATINVTIQEEGASLDDLVSKTKNEMSDLLKLLKDFKIPEKDMQTTQYSIRPKYNYDNHKTTRDGYTVTNQLKFLLRDLTQLGDVLGAVSGADTFQVDGPTFSFSNPAKLQLEALKAAMDNAHTKAEVLAESAGAEVGPVISIEQTGVSMPTIRPAVMAMAQSVGSVASAVPVEQGTDQVTAQVEVVYTLK
jgi:uncharacterized protein YggE